MTTTVCDRELFRDGIIAQISRRNVFIAIVLDELNRSLPSEVATVVGEYVWFGIEPISDSVADYILEGCSFKIDEQTVCVSTGMSNCNHDCCPPSIHVLLSICNEEYTLPIHSVVNLVVFGEHAEISGLIQVLTENADLFGDRFNDEDTREHLYEDFAMRATTKIRNLLLGKTSNVVPQAEECVGCVI